MDCFLKIDKADSDQCKCGLGDDGDAHREECPELDDLTRRLENGERPLVEAQRRKVETREQGERRRRRRR